MTFGGREIDRPTTGVEVHTFRNGATWIVALLSNPEPRVNELGPPEFQSNALFEKPQNVRLVLPSEANAYDIRRHANLGRRKDIDVTLDPYEPAIFAFSAEVPPDLRVTIPSQAGRGDVTQIAFGFEAPSPAAVHVLHIDVLDPSGKVHAEYSGNLLVNGGTASKPLAFAINDPVGRWTVRARDILTGREATAAIEVC